MKVDEKVKVGEKVKVTKNCEHMLVTMSCLWNERMGHWYIREVDLSHPQGVPIF